MLTIKLFLVPAFLAFITFAGKRWGANVAGWLAGLPVVTGPILFILALENDASFAAVAATASLSAVFASVSFSITYAHACIRFRCLPSLFCGLFAWLVAALILSFIPSSILSALVIALSTLVAASRAFPKISRQVSSNSIRASEIIFRMIAGAILTVLVTTFSSSLGASWSGLLAVFPILAIVLAAFSHKTQGAAFAVSLLRGMVTGLYSFVAFCLTLSVALVHASLALSFISSIAAAIIVQVATKNVMKSKGSYELHSKSDCEPPVHS
ncbi:hypothetical protein [Massilia sp. CT11-137]|uniref:hypothetical protein n=1 Tax=Massilia sp. CT11-137 TaxID=3393901 RepID=UPI0039A5134E